MELAKWIRDHWRQSWAVLIIDDFGRFTLISDNHQTHSGKVTPYCFGGLHYRNIKIYVNMEKQPDFIKDQVHSLSTAMYASVSNLQP